MRDETLVFWFDQEMKDRLQVDGLGEIYEGIMSSDTWRVALALDMAWSRFVSSGDLDEAYKELLKWLGLDTEKQPANVNGNVLN